ncbi:MAG: response regulator [Eubacteriales bacterium]
MYNVLIVDDEPLMRKYMTDNLSRIDNRWTVTDQTEDGLQAVSLMKNKSFDLVITDIKMPEMDGLALAKHIQKNYPDTKVIIVSGFDEFQYAQEAVRCNVHDYLLKPLMDENIMEALDRVAKSIEKQQALGIILKTMNSLPNKSTEELLSNFLSALINENHADIKTLYPLIHSMQINIIEGLATALILSLDESSIFMSRKSVADLPIYRMILHQKIIEITKSNKNIPICYDKSDNTVVLITGEDVETITAVCRKLFEEICCQLESQSDIKLICAFGEPVEDILQLHTAYDTASESLKLALFRIPSPISPNRFISQRHFLNNLNETLNAIDTDLTDNDSSRLYNDLFHYTVLMPENPGVEQILRFGLFLINRLAGESKDRQERIEQSLKPMTRLLNTVSENQPEDYKNITALFLASVSALVENSSNPDGNEYGVLSDKAKEYICMHYNEPISLALVADILGVSASYLCDVFHKNIGETYSKFLTRIRMEQAALLLKSNPDERIYTISEQVGYISDKHFTTVFKRHFNMTPKEYQQQKKKI